MESVKHTISNIMGKDKDDTTSSTHGTHGTHDVSSTSTGTGPTTTGSTATGGYEHGATSTGSNLTGSTATGGYEHGAAQTGSKFTGSTGDETFEHGGHAPIHDSVTQGRDTEHQSSQTMGHGSGLEHQSHQPTTQGTGFEQQSGSGYGSTLGTDSQYQSNPTTTTHGTDSQYQAPAHEATSHGERDIHQQAQHAHQEHQAQQTTSHSSESTEHKSHHGLQNLLHHNKSPASSSDQVDESSSSHHQNSSQGRDPAVIDKGNEKKLTGTGVPGSHSAVFGLTPTGEKITDTDSTTTAPRPAHSKSRDETAGGGDNSSRAPAGGEKLTEQMHNPRDQGPKGLERTDPVSGVETSDSSKPGAGGVGLGQGTGDVRPGEKGGL
ncbi:hypothetical protein LTR72_006026 [Exophiala xenobiotica]|nr:hypothetical protein LTR72_006026 [Exophiala xenobiotica]KAK5294806.1 hypothetical protein LTR14_003974 [Exophiala xenobiotica]KAK5438555.1 hypothetical protein LTR18_008531 [Exophiala xenobiotica]KAK5483154.1 hypothetical protein LTR55_006554 [Exophiala xenobiotica]